MKKLVTTAAAVSLLTVSGAAWVVMGSDRLSAQEGNGEPQLNRAQVETIVRDYLLANPEILLEVQERLTAKQQQEQQAAVRGEIAAVSNQLFHAPQDAVLGNPEGDVTIVEFYDYNCGYCRRALNDMEALLDSDQNVRFILKDFPVLGPESQQAHMVAMAFRSLAPERYEEFHKRLLNSKGRANEDTAMQLAIDLGVNEAALRKAMKDPQIAKNINETYELANRLHITGTPSYVIDDEVVPGAVGHELLTEKIAEARQ